MPGARSISRKAENSGKLMIGYVEEFLRNSYNNKICWNVFFNKSGSSGSYFFKQMKLKWELPTLAESGICGT